MPQLKACASACGASLNGVQCAAQTFEEADLAKDGRISHEEWLILVQKHPVIINYMTLPVLREVRVAAQHPVSEPQNCGMQAVQALPICRLPDQSNTAPWCQTARMLRLATSLQS